MNERRLTQHPDGTVTGHFIGDNTKKIKETVTAASMTDAISNIMSNQRINVATTVFPTVPSLTAQQRVNELIKKIAEYRSLLSVVTDATTKNLVDLFLVNISKELSEIQAELGKNQVQQPPQVFPTPWNPGMPYGPLDTGTPRFPNISDGIKYFADGAMAVPGTDYVETSTGTVCAGKTCITYPLDGPIPTLSEFKIIGDPNGHVTIQHNNEDNQ